MLRLDMRTVILCYSLITVLCAAVLAFQWRLYRRRYGGLGFWVADYAFQFLGLGLIAARGAIPDLLSMTGGNVLIVAGFALLMRGLRTFFGMRAGGAIDWAIVGAFGLAHAWLVVGRPDLGAREVALSLAMILMCLRGIQAFAKIDPGLRRVSRGSALVLAAFALAASARIAHVFALPLGQDFFAVPSFDALILVAYLALFIALTFSLVAMIGRRIYLEQERVIAERSRAEAALRTSEEKFSKAFQASPDAMAISRLEDGRFIEVNDSFCRLSGYSRAEVLDGPPIEVWADRRDRDALLRELLASSTVRGWPITAVGKYGNPIRADVSGGIVELDGRRHILSIIHDHSERDRAEAILQTRLMLWEYAPGHSVEELMVKALDSIEAMTNSAIGFYHFVDEEKGVLTRQAWSTRTAAACRASGPADAPYPLEKAGIWADCVRERRPIVHNDCASLGKPGRQPPGHPEVRRELVAPTIRDGRVVAILGVGNKAIDYNEDDAALVSYIVDLVWTIVVQKQADERILVLNRRLEQLAMTDDLTGLANRRAFFELAGRELSKVRRYGTPLSVVMLDIDRFKQVNDLHGHDMGDAALRMVAEVLRSHVRGVDAPARLGGEEFGILLPSTRLEDAARSAERLRAAIEGASHELRGITIRVTASLGVASASGSGPDLDALMREADQALYRAKQAGRNRVEVSRLPA